MGASYNKKGKFGPGYRLNRSGAKKCHCFSLGNEGQALFQYIIFVLFAAPKFLHNFYIKTSIKSQIVSIFTGYDSCVGFDVARQIRDRQFCICQMFRGNGTATITGKKIVNFLR